MAFIYGDGIVEQGDWAPFVFVKASTIGSCGLPTKDTITTTTTFTSALNNYQEIGILEKGHKLEAKHTDATQASDRSVFHNGKTVTFDATFLELTEDNIAYLKTTYENISCDVCFFDNRDGVVSGAKVIVAYGLRLTFDYNVVNHDIMKLRIYGEAYEPTLGDVLVFHTLTSPA